MQYISFSGLCYNSAMKNTKKAVSRNQSKRKQAKPAMPTPVKRPRGRPPKVRPEEPPAPPPAQDAQLLETLLLRLVSPLKSLPVQTNEAVFYIRPEDIAYLTTTADRRILIVDRAGREWQRFDMLSALEKRLSADPRFFRSHKSFLINVFAVKTLRKNPETNGLEVTFGDQVKGAAAVSAGNLKQLRALLEL